MTATGEIIHDRTFSTVIARATVCQRQQMQAHGLQFSDMPLNVSHLFQGALFHIRAMTRRIVKQVYQLAALFQVKPNLPRLTRGLPEREDSLEESYWDR